MKMKGHGEPRPLSVNLLEAPGRVVRCSVVSRTRSFSTSVAVFLIFPVVCRLDTHCDDDVHSSTRPHAALHPGRGAQSSVPCSVCGVLAVVRRNRSRLPTENLDTRLGSWLWESPQRDSEWL